MTDLHGLPRFLEWYCLSSEIKASTGSNENCDISELPALSLTQVQIQHPLNECC